MAELNQRINAEIITISSGPDGFQWKWNPVWPPNSPTISWDGGTYEEARAAYRMARRIWYRDLPPEASSDY